MKRKINLLTQLTSHVDLTTCHVIGKLPIVIVSVYNPSQPGVSRNYYTVTVASLARLGLVKLLQTGRRSRNRVLFNLWMMLVTLT